MIDRNTDLRAFQHRAIQACGSEFVSIPTFAAAMGLGEKQTYRLAGQLNKIGSKYLVADLAEQAYNLIYPRCKRVG